MAYLESAVVVYLRQLYGINFLMITLPPFDPQIARIEIGREAATLVMLWAVGWLSGNNQHEKIAYSMIAFGVWDVFYYFWLWVMVGWPASLLDQDLLFLIPLPWWGPVLAPVLIAVLMVISGVRFVSASQAGFRQHMRPLFWVLLGAGVLVMLLVFMADAIQLLPADAALLSSMRPGPFNWPVFLAGFLLVLIAVFHPSLTRAERL